MKRQNKSPVEFYKSKRFEFGIWVIFCSTLAELVLQLSH